MNKPSFQVDPDYYHLHIWRIPGADPRIRKYDSLEQIVQEYNLDIDNPNPINVEDALNDLSGPSDYVLMGSFKEVKDET